MPAHKPYCDHLYWSLSPLDNTSFSYTHCSGYISITNIKNIAAAAEIYVSSSPSVWGFLLVEIHCLKWLLHRRLKSIGLTQIRKISLYSAYDWIFACTWETQGLWQILHLMYIFSILCTLHCTTSQALNDVLSRFVFSLAANRGKRICFTACLNLYCMSTTASVFAKRLYDCYIFCIITWFFLLPIKSFFLEPTPRKDCMVISKIFIFFIDWGTQKVRMFNISPTEGWATVDDRPTRRDW